MSTLRAMDLFQAYSSNKLPPENGYIISSFFKNDSAYSIYEIVSYAALKDMYLTGNGLTFITNGKKVFLFVEPENYIYKSVEPYFREKGYQIPIRFRDTQSITTKNKLKIIYSRKAQETLSSFTVLKPTGIDFSFLFYPRPDVFSSIELFFEQTLSKEAAVPLRDAKNAAHAISEVIKKVLVWPHANN